MLQEKLHNKEECETNEEKKTVHNADNTESHKAIHSANNTDSASDSHSQPSIKTVTPEERLRRAIKKWNITGGPYGLSLYAARLKRRCELIRPSRFLGKFLNHLVWALKFCYYT